MVLVVIAINAARRLKMAYFLKQTKLKNRTYLSIVYSFYDAKRKETAHKVYKSLKSIETWQNKGIGDPVSHFQKEVDKLNQENKKTKVKKIGKSSPVIHCGHFLLKTLFNRLDVSTLLRYMHLVNDFDFDIPELLSSLIYARAINPCSKLRTHEEVLPCMPDVKRYSYNQILTGLEFFGHEYQKFVEVFTLKLKELYGINTDTSYFDCTNYYFEINKEDDLRRKGPSKENRKNPIVGMGLLLDANIIPIGMKLYSGNQSEKPVLRELVKKLKSQHHIIGRTIQVADKGLNCANNIIGAIKDGDGYLFSRSVKNLPEMERNWLLNDKGFNEVRDKDGKLKYCYKSVVDTFDYSYKHEGKTIKVPIKEKRLLTYNPKLAEKQRHEILKMKEKACGLMLSQAKKKEYGEASKYVNFTDKTGRKAVLSLNEKAIEKDWALAGYNLLVTSELKMEDEKMYEVYHNLWRIEESFKIMKSDLNARPVFLQKEDTIKGHFLICYLTVMLERILQFHVFDGKYCSGEIIRFIRDFNIVKACNQYINLAKKSDFIKDISERFNLPLENYNLKQSEVSKIMNNKKL